MNVFELIKEKIKNCDIEYPYFAQCDNNEPIKNQMLNIVDEVAQEYNNGWIPCSERLPDDFMGFEYLTVRRNQINVSISYFCCVNHKWYTSRNSKQEVDVIMWNDIPLPAPYKEGGV